MYLFIINAVFKKDTFLLINNSKNKRKEVTLMDSSTLRPGQMIVVEGNVNYCRLTRKIEGTALDEYNRNSKSKFPETKPFVTITIDNPAIVIQNGIKTPEDSYVENKFYDSTADPKNPKRCFRINSKNNQLPKFYQVTIDENGNINPNRIQEKPRLGELAQGLKVRLMLRVYQTNYSNNKGLSLEMVIAQEPIRYFRQGENLAISYLKQTGITVESMSDDDRAREEAAAAAAAQPVTAEPQKAPVQTPPVPNETPYRNSAPMTPPVQAAPPVQQAPPANWTCPVCQHINDASSKFCGGCGNPKDSGATSNFRPQGGIQFDPNDMNKTY